MKARIKMAVPLGPTIRTPAFLVLQITLCLSIFYVSLSVSYLTERIVGELVAAAFTPKSLLEPDKSLADFLCINVSDLFWANTSSGTYVSFFLMHILCAFLSTKFLAKVVQRSRDASDYVLTVYLLHYSFSAIVMWSFFPGGFVYLLGLFIAGALTTFLLRRKTTKAELAEIHITPV